MPPIKVSILPGAHPLSYNNNITSTYSGLVELPDDSCKLAVIKDIPPKEVANELLAAELAGALDLPVPQHFVALASIENLPSKYGYRLTESHRVVFASERKGTPPFADMWIAERPSPRRYLDRLASWNKCGRAIGFDVWTANTDRHPGNILYDGDGEPWLIDHGRCFTSEFWVADELLPSGNYRNRLAEWLLPHIDANGKNRLLAAVDALATAVTALDLDEIARISHVKSLLTSADTNAILTFLGDRRAHFAALYRQQAGHLL